MLPDGVLELLPVSDDDAVGVPDVLAPSDSDALGVTLPVGMMLGDGTRPRRWEWGGPAQRLASSL